MSDPTPRLARTILIFEALVVMFGALVARALTDLGTAATLGGGGALALALLLATGLLRRRTGIVAGSVLQVALLGTALVVPEMLVLAVVFVALWVAALVLGHRAAAAAGSQGGSGRPGGH
ncbi:MAG: DUF4233 domain-containing protein [Kineosporiaceae bacterium]